MFAENTIYEIMTPDGWKDFRGISKNGEKITFTISLENGEQVRATENHCFFKNNIKVKLCDLAVGDSIDTIFGLEKIVDIQQNPPTVVYDVVEVDDHLHRFIVNKKIVTKNCDELSYVEPNIAKEFWTSISPTLATGGKALITSTPNSDEDQFAEIWHAANKRFDEYGNEQELGQNGFFPYLATWDKHPDRDQKWAAEEMARIGSEKFEREHNCLGANSMLTLQDTFGNVFNISMGDFYNLCCLYDK